MGKLGLAQGSSDSVKMFSQQLADDHAKGNKQLAELAAKKNVTLPAEASPGPAEQMLAKHTGAGFDQNYIKAMIADHQKDIQEFEKEVSSGSDPEVKQWASDTLPTLRSHLEQAKALATPMPGTK